MRRCRCDRSRTIPEAVRREPGGERNGPGRARGSVAAPARRVNPGAALGTDPPPPDALGAGELAARGRADPAGRGAAPEGGSDRDARSSLSAAVTRVRSWSDRYNAAEPRWPNTPAGRRARRAPYIACVIAACPRGEEAVDEPRARRRRMGTGAVSLGYGVGLGSRRARRRRRTSATATRPMIPRRAAAGGVPAHRASITRRNPSAALVAGALAELLCPGGAPTRAVSLEVAELACMKPRGRATFASRQSPVMSTIWFASFVLHRKSSATFHGPTPALPVLREVERIARGREDRVDRHLPDRTMVRVVHPLVVHEQHRWIVASSRSPVSPRANGVRDALAKGERSAPPGRRGHRGSRRRPHRPAAAAARCSRSRMRGELRRASVAGSSDPPCRRASRGGNGTSAPSWTQRATVPAAPELDVVGMGRHHQDAFGGGEAVTWHGSDRHATSPDAQPRTAVRA